MSGNALEELVKLATESIIFNMDFTKRLETLETIDTINTAVSVSLNRISGSSNIVINTQVISGNIIQMKLSGGSTHEQYTIIVNITTSTGNVREGKGLLRVE